MALDLLRFALLQRPAPQRDAFCLGAGEAGQDPLANDGPLISGHVFERMCSDIGPRQECGRYTKAAKCAQQ
jgi:hypothetical protein